MLSKRNGLNDHIERMGGCDSLPCTVLHISHCAETQWYMHAADMLEITVSSGCLQAVFWPMHACTLLSIHKIIVLYYWTVQQCVPVILHAPICSTVWIQRDSFFALGSKQSIFFPSHTFSHSCATVFISQLLSISFYVRPSPPLLALVLMHSQSGCPLGRHALHVHQAVQRPACKWAQIAVRCKLLEISSESERERETCMCENCRRKWASACPLHANENAGASIQRD